MGQLSEWIGAARNQVGFFESPFGDGANIAARPCEPDTPPDRRSVADDNARREPELGAASLTPPTHRVTTGRGIQRGLSEMQKSLGAPRKLSEINARNGTGVSAL